MRDDRTAAVAYIVMSTSSPVFGPLDVGTVIDGGGAGVGGGCTGGGATISPTLPVTIISTLRSMAKAIDAMLRVSAIAITKLKPILNSRLLNCLPP